MSSVRVGLKTDASSSSTSSLDRGGDLDEVVDDEVGDGVEHGGRAQAEQVALLLEAAAQLGQAAVLPVPDGDHVVGAEEDHHLAGVDDLAGRGQLLVLHVARRSSAP